MKRISTLLMPLCIVASVANAQQFEATLDYARTDTDVSGGATSSSNTDRTLVGLTYYFTPLETAKGPLALASFFGRNSMLRTSYALGNVSSGGAKVDLDAYSLSGRYVNADSGWLLDAAFTQTDVDTTPATRSNTYSVAIGKYFAPTSTISLGLSHTDDDANGDNTRLSLANFHAQALGNDTYFDGGVELSYVDTDAGDNGYELQLATTYYPSRELGLELFAGYADVGSNESLIYGVAAEYYLTDSFAINARYIETDAETGLIDIDTETFSIGMQLRF